MARLCFGADAVGPSSSGASDGVMDDYWEEEYDEEPGVRGRDDLDDVAAVAGAGSEAASPTNPNGGCSARGAPWTLPATASILLLLFLS